MKITELSLREKILQTVVIKVDKDNFVSDQVGGAFFGGEIITDAEDVGLETGREILRRYQENAKIPILLTGDFENGCGSVWKGLTPLPYLMSLGAANDEQLAYEYGKATALEATMVGANWSFSPVCDLNINRRNPLVNVRALTDDPELAVKLLPQIIRGMQENGLAACAKHFPGDGVDYRDQHIVTTRNTLSMEDWKATYGKVFEEMIKAGVLSIMPGHIALPAYQKETAINGLALPATLSHELITKLLKEEMGFKGVVVSDALNMGGFNGWYPSRARSEIECFKAGCDMMLWPTKEYVDNMEQAIRSGYVEESRLDDAVSRILRMKEKMGLFERKSESAGTLTESEKSFVKQTQQKTAERSITLVRDDAGIFPLTTEKFRKIKVIPITHYAPALQEAELLCEELKVRGFEVDYQPNGLKHIKGTMAEEDQVDDCDLVLYALFSRSFRPIGFLDFHSTEAMKVWRSLEYGGEKTAVVSFGSPYFGEQYFERALTYVNAYSMLSPSVKAFVRAAVGETEFTDYSPVRLQLPGMG